MKRYYLIAAFLFCVLVGILPHYLFVTTWYVRNDGSDSVCNGTTNASAAAAPNCAYATPVQAITSAACGDTIKALAGDTFDTTGIVLPDKSCSVSTPITITSTATLPSRRVGPGDASLMPRFRTTSTVGDGVFKTAANAGWWILDGLEITDNAGTNTINFLLDWGVSNAGAHDMVITRSYFHQKETGTTYTRSVVRAMQFEGANLSYTKNYVFIIGHSYATTEPYNSEGLLSVSGPGPITMTDNYISVWYNGIFLGGGDTAPNQTATLTSASTTSATFSNTTGLVDDVTFIRFSVLGTAILSNAGGDCSAFGLSPGNCPTLTQATGDPWVDADGNQNGNYGDSVLVTSVADPTKFGITRLQARTGSVFTTTIATSSAGQIPNGAVTYVLYQTAKVTNIAGSVITYDPLGTTAGIDYGTNSLNHPPASAAWNAGDGGRIVDTTVNLNTFEVDIAFAVYLQGIGRGCPKGAFEIKNADRFLFDRNNIIGYPAVLAATAANQNGTAPWITFDHAAISNNWIHPDTGYLDCSRSAILFADDAYLNTITPTTTITITNNLVTGGVREFADIKNGNVWTMTHNTSINSQLSNISINALLSAQAAGIPALTFTDNIGDVVCYGIKDYPSFWVSPVINHNVLVDTSACSGGINVNTYGTASALSPIPTLFSQVGFTSIAGNNYQLTPASNYYHAGNGGDDPGVFWNTSNAPWLTVPTPTNFGGNLKVSGNLTIH